MMRVEKTTLTEEMEVAMVIKPVEVIPICNHPKCLFLRIERYRQLLILEQIIN